MAAILLLVLAVVILQFAVIRMPTHLFLQFIIGAAMVIGGMTLFLLGAEIGIPPMGKALGAELPKRKSLFLVTGIAFLIGFAATVAQPDVIVLTRQVDAVSQGAIAKNVLICVIAIGVDFFVAMSMFRIFTQFSYRVSADSRLHYHHPCFLHPGSICPGRL